MSRLDDHYDALRSRDGFGPVDVGLGDASAADLRRRFAAVYDRAVLARAFDRETLFCTGIGMTGPPHVGSLAAMAAALELQALGADVQFVLADLEPYHGGHDLARVRDLARRYRAFLLDLGFDPDRGTLRTQSEARDVLHTAQVLAPYYTPEASDYAPETPPTAWERAVEAAYEAAPDDARPDGPTSAAAATHSAVLHLADFLHPLRRGYDQVVVTLGADEYALSVATDRFLAETPVEGRVGGLHGRMIPGSGDAPKVSKGVPGSGPHLGMDPAALREAVLAMDDDPGPSRPLTATSRLAVPAVDDGEGPLPDRPVDDHVRDLDPERCADRLAALAERWAATA